MKSALRVKSSHWVELQSVLPSTMNIFDISTIDADSGFSSFSFTMKNCELHLGKTTLEGEEIKLEGLPLEIGYDSFGRLIGNLSSDGIDNFAGLALVVDYPRILNKEYGLDAQFLVIKGNFMGLQIIPKNPPLKTGKGDETDEVNKVTAYLLNGPEILLGEQLSVFIYKNVKMILTRTNAGKEARKNERYYKNDIILTHKIQVANINGTKNTLKDVCDALYHFRRFLLFVRGGYVGLGHIVGHSKDQHSFAHLGWESSDQFKMPPNWFDVSLAKDLNIIYQKYTALLSNDEDIFPILRCLEFYRAASTIQDTTVEVALVSSYAALETIVPHLLLTRAGWSKELINKNSRFSDQIRAAAAFIKLTSDPFEHLTDLKTAMDTRIISTGNKMDAYDFLALYRNRMTHPKKGFKYGFEIYEACQLSQWLVEVFIFYFMKYDGEIQDRRNRTGFRGTTKPIPIQY